MYKHLLSVILSLLMYTLQAQNIIGDWQKHYAFENGLQLSASNNALFCLSESGLFSYSLLGEVSIYDKLNGLSDLNISIAQWSTDNDLLFIAYDNGNIDLLTKNNVYNIPDIKIFNINSDKRINDVYFYAKYAYLACNFALVVIDLEKKELSETYYIGSEGEPANITSVAIVNNYIYAGSEDFLKRIKLDDNNISDYRNWETKDVYNGSYFDIINVNEEVFFARKKPSSVVDILKGEELNVFINNLSDFSSIKYLEDEFFIVAEGQLNIYNNEGEKIDNINKYYLDGNLYKSDFNDALKWNSKYYFADKNNALLQFVDVDNTKEINVNGPVSNSIVDMMFADDKIFTLLEESGKTYLNTYGNSFWSHKIEQNIPLLAEENILSFVADKIKTNKIFVSTNKSNIYSLINTTAEKIIVPEIFKPMNASLMATDKKGQLWMLDNNDDLSVKVKTQDNKWYELLYTKIKYKEYKKLLCLASGDKWMLSKQGDHIFAFNENKTLNNIENDATISFVPSDKDDNVLANLVHDMIEDQNANMWLATDKGVVVYSQASHIFREGDFYASRPIVNIDDENFYLLGTENVNCISIDGANRKWLGTKSSGLFLVSENGDKQLKHFNINNSPLPSNNILDICVNNANGELLIKTDKGLVSYKTSVTKGENNFDNLYVYPNPVRENYNSNIVITGLMQGASVKITNINAQLVAEGFAKGGQFVWDGKNLNNNRLSTGVYLIFCSNKDGSKSKIIKLLFIN